MNKQIIVSPADVNFRATAWKQMRNAGTVS